MASLEDYLRGADVPSREASEYEKLFKGLKGLQSSRDVAAALGAEPDVNPAMGILNYLFSPSEGKLTAGGRVIRSGIFKALGEPEADPSGFGNFRGLRVQESDNPLEKVGKLGTALALDIATDPLSFVGAPTSIGRAGVSKIATSLGAPTLKNLAKAANVSEEALIGKLAERSRVGQAAALQRQTGLEDLDVKGLARNLVDTEDGKRLYAERELGNIVGEALYTRGRRGIVSDLTSVLRLLDVDEATAEKAARQTFAQLPSEVQGGLGIVQPFTGRRLSRLAPAESTGLLESAGLGAVADVGNRARLFAARTAGLPATRYLSGVSGPILQGVKKGTKGIDRLPDPVLGRVTLLDWAQFGKVAGARNQILSNLHAKFLSPVVIAGAKGSTIEKEFGKEAKDRYVDLLFENLTRPSRPAALDDNIAVEAASEAANIRGAMNELLQEMRDAGFDVADISPDFFPLMFTDEGAALFKQMGRAGRVSTGYTGAGGRKFGFKTISDPNEGDDFGFLIQGTDDVYAANPRTASKLVMDKLRAQGVTELPDEMFVTDPIKAMSRYVEVMSERLSTKRFVDSIVESGLAVRDVPTTVKRLNDRATNLLRSAVRAVSPGVREIADRQAKEAQDELAALASEGAGVASRLRTELKKARDVYMSSKESEKLAAAAAKEARANVAKARAMSSDVVRELREYSESGAAYGDVLAAQANAANAGQRAKRAGERATESEQALYDLETLAKTLDDRYDAMVSRQVDDARDDALDALLTAEEAALFATSARQFATTMRAARQEIEGRLSSSAVKRMNELEDALNKQAIAAEAYAAAARTRRLNKETYDRVRRLRAEEKANAVNVVAETFINARTARKAAELAGEPPSTVAALREAEKNAEDALNNIFAKMKQLRAPGNEAVTDYVRNLEAAVKKLNTAEFEAAAVFSSEQKIRDVVEMFGQTFRTPEELDAAFTDMVTSYNVVRDKITPEQLDALSPLQQATLRAGTNDLILTPTKRSEFGDMLSRGNPNAALHPIGGAFEDVYAPLEVKESIDKLFDMTRRPDEWRQKIEDYLDPALLLWRLQVTQFRLGAYTFMNFAGGTFNNMIGDVSLANSMRSAKTIAKFIQAERQIAKEFPGTPDIAAREKIRVRLEELVGAKEYADFEAWLTRGGADVTSTIEQIRQATRLGSDISQVALTRRGSRALSQNVEPTSALGKKTVSAVDFILTNRVSGFLSDANQTTEMYLRYAAFKQGVEKFNNYDAAMDLSMALHFDYGDLSNAEKWARRIMPFYVWSRNNIPLQIRTMFLQPSKMTKFLYAREEIENYYGDDQEWLSMLLPEYAKTSGGFALKVGDQRLFVMDRLPYSDLDRLFQVSAMPVRTRELANMVGPAGGLYGILSGVDTGTGRAFDPAGTPAPLWAQPLAAAGLLPRNEQGEGLVPEQFAALVSEALPSLGVIERGVAGVAGMGPSSQTDRRTSNLLNFLGLPAILGQTTGTLTPRTARGEIRRQQEIITNAIISAAEETGVDLDWVREQVRSGESPENILAMIRSGRGREQSAMGEDSVSIDREQRAALEQLIEGLQ